MSRLLQALVYSIVLLEFLNGLNVADGSKCIECGKGSYSNQSNPVCKACNHTGWCQSANNCTKCSPGSFQGKTGQQSCQSCIPGFYSKNAKSTKCDPCSIGTFANVSGSTNCFPCPKGHYGKFLNATSCFSCPQGSYQDKTGQTTCIPCQADTYCGTPGCEVCKDCGRGKDTNLKTNQTKCRLCPAGTCKSAEDHMCNVCPRGFYQVYTGRSKCRQCPEAFYCPYPDENPKACDPDQYCPAGSFQPGEDNACQPLYSKDGDTCYPGAFLIVLITIGAVIFITIILYAVRSVRGRRLANRYTEERRRLISNAVEPSYAGW